MRDEDGESHWQQSTEGALEVLGLKVVAVVDACDPYALAIPLNFTGVVYKKRNPMPPQRVNDF